MVKAYGYLRVSGLGQVDGDGFDRQKEQIISFADQAGIVIPRFYEEQGISGAKGEEDRPAFQEMLTAIVERLDWLAREYRVQEELLACLSGGQGDHPLELRHWGKTFEDIDAGRNLTVCKDADDLFGKLGS